MPHEARPVTPESDEIAIWKVIDAEQSAYWMRDFEGYARLHVNATYFRYLCWLRGGGITTWNGWAPVSEAMHRDIEQDPDQNAVFAFHVTMANRNLRVLGDMAWATFDRSFPTLDLPGFYGPSSLAHEVRILERHSGEWKIAFVAILDEQFGQTDTPTWEIDESGRILRANSAGTAFLKVESEICTRAGRLRMRDADTDRKFSAAREAAMAVHYGIVSGYGAFPVLFDPGNDLPARIWWVIREGGRLLLSFNDALLTEKRLDIGAHALGLSPSQFRVVVAIAEGLPLPEIARREGVRLTTVRTQLQRIFDKVGVRSQPALMRALLSAAEPEWAA